MRRACCSRLTNPNLEGHNFLSMVFPCFTFLTIGSFICGLVASGVYGWTVAITFVFFYNLWPVVVAYVFGQRTPAW